MATVMIAFGNVVTQLLIGQTVHLAVGSGLSEWDSLTTIPQPAPNRTTLYNELARAVATVNYIDDAGTISLTNTRRIEASATFGTGVANGTIREVGLFLLGSGTINSGTLIAGIHVAAIVKPSGGSDFALTRALRLGVLP